MPDTFSTPTSTSTSTSSSSTIDLTCAMHDLNPDEQCTCESIVRAAPGSTICPMPTHHIDPHGWLSGFTFSCPGASPISALPLSRHTFFGHTACECTASSADIIRLLSDVEGARRTMQSLLLSVRERCKSSPVATFACRPENAEGYLRGGHVAGIRTKRTVDSQEWVPEVPDLLGIYHSFVRGHNRDTRVHKLFIIVSGGCGKASDEFYNCVLDCHGHATARDCCMSEEAWWLRRASYRSRLLAECAEAFELQVCTIRDIHAYDNTTASTGGGHGCDTCTAGSASDEGGVRIAVPSIDTVTHDLCMSQHIGSSDGAGGGGGGGNAGSGGAAAVVELYDTCVNVGTVRNGLLCAMHPSEGFWIFQGAQNRAQGGNAYGSAWHSRHHRAVGMPTSVIKVHYSDATRKGNTSHHGGGGGGGGGVGSHHSTTSAHHSATSVLSVGGTVKDRNSAMVRSLQYAVVSTTDSHSIVRVNAVDKSRRVQVPTPAGAGEFRRVEVAPEPERDSLYQFFDEQYLSLVSRAMRWPRDRGVVELIPIVVGMGVVG